MAEYLRIGEVAKAVGVSVDTVRRWEAEGRVSFERQGNQRVLAAAALAPLVASLHGSTQALQRSQPVGRRTGSRSGEGHHGHHRAVVPDEGRSDCVHNRSSLGVA
jgi:excisionase family DNA binding protein